MLFLAFVFLASPLAAQSSPTCSTHVSQGASDPGECLLQPNVAQNTFQKRADVLEGHHESVVAEESAEEEDASDDDDDDEDEEHGSVQGALSDPDASGEAGDDFVESELQMNSTQFPFDGSCYNWFGNGLDWKELEAKGIAKKKGNSGVWGTLLNNKYYPDANVCSWDTTAGVDLPTMELSYYCAGKLGNGRVGACRSTTIRGKGQGIRVDCFNGICLDASNIKHDWSPGLKGVTCTRAKRVGPILHLKSPKGNPQLSKWDPACKVACESIPECTGFTLHIIRRRPQCLFFGEMDQSRYDAGKSKCGTARRCCNGKKSVAFGCCNHPHYNTFFVTRKVV